ncbi:hypothetical protein lerEdw1_002426 [Lerista edwardsae]|nr:hypothetical protein lerEdw1_002426 [Lerista edwardsae]
MLPPPPPGGEPWGAPGSAPAPRRFLGMDFPAWGWTRLVPLAVAALAVLPARLEGVCVYRGSSFEVGQL